MTRVRRLLGPLATIWLTCQVATLALALPAFWAQPAGASELACTCPDGADRTCPMHHKAPPSSKPCSMRGVDDSWAAALGPMLGAAGLLPTRTSTPVPASVVTALFVASSTASDRPVPPDSPPPRA